MRAVLLDVVRKECREIDIQDRLEDYYKVLDCNLIEVAERKVNGVWFDIMCDEEGLLKGEPMVSAVDGEYHPMLVGNLLFLHSDPNTGEFVGISKPEAEMLLSNYAFALSDGRPVMMRCEYN